VAKNKRLTVGEMRTLITAAENMTRVAQAESALLRHRASMLELRLNATREALAEERHLPLAKRLYRYMTELLP
jgi:hypothetical protein